MDMYMMVFFKLIPHNLLIQYHCKVLYEEKSPKENEIKNIYIIASSEKHQRINTFAARGHILSFHCTAIAGE